MRKIAVILAVSALFVSIISKAEEIISNGFIFPDYQKGKVYFKNNEVTEALLNYEIVAKQMLFKQNDIALVLGLPQATDSVVISGRVFVYFKGNEFFEKISVGKGDVYIQYNSTLLQDAKEAGYGGYSQVSNTKSIGSLSSLDGGQTISLTHLSAKERFKIKMVYVFWIKRGDQFIKVNSRNQIFKAFPEKKQQIQLYLDSHKTSFEDLDEVKKLLDYCF